MNRMSMLVSRRSRTFAVLAAALGALFFFRVVSIWSLPAIKKSPPMVIPMAPPDPSVPSSERESLEKEALAQEKVFAAERDEITSLNDSVKFLISVAGVFAILLGAASWSALREQRREAGEALSVQEKKFAIEFEGLLSHSKISLDGVERLRDEVQRDFPMFGRMRANFAVILYGLQSACARLQPDDDTYKSLRWDEEQRILFYESAITTALLLDTKDHDKQLSEIYRLLGVFYGSRYFFNRKESTKDSPRIDLDRSRFYFDRSIDLDPKNYLSYMHAGHFTQYYDDTELERASIDYYQRASVVGENYQKPFTSIAMIELEGFGDPDRALRTLEQAKSKPKYDVDRDRHENEFIAYLESYAFCLKAENETGDARLEVLRKALEKFAVAVQRDTPKMKEMFDADIGVFSRAFAKFPSFLQEFRAHASKLTGLVSDT